MSNAGLEENTEKNKMKGFLKMASIESDRTVYIERCCNHDFNQTCCAPKLSNKLKCII